MLDFACLPSQYCGMTFEPAEILRSIYRQLRTSHRALALLFGRDQNTIYRQLNGKVIPDGTKHYLRSIESIRIQPGFAIITLDMPADTPIAEYRREWLSERDLAPTLARNVRAKSL